jgi:phosphoribosyl 1,2-cyclic phosphodiesterase
VFALSGGSPSVSEISVRFWGVRGSIACPGDDFRRYGGNTACVDVRCGDHLVVFDAGTGMRPLGNLLARSAQTIEADIFLSHFHMDHVNGLPFFAPFYQSGNRLRVWAGNLLPERRIEEAMRTIMADPLYPTGVGAFKAAVEFRDFRAGEALRPRAGMALRTAPLNHPGRATGYRLEFGGKSIAYVTDTEHRAGRLDDRVLDLAAGVDVMIYDGNYTDAEWQSRIGWGHSTWQEGVRLADAAGARRLVVFHHDPEHDDGFLDRVASEAEAMRPGTLVAAEGAMLVI